MNTILPEIVNDEGEEFTKVVNEPFEQKPKKRYLPCLVTRKNLVQVSRELNIPYHVPIRRIREMVYENNFKLYITRNNVNGKYDFLINQPRSHTTFYNLGYLFALLIEFGYPVQVFETYLEQICSKKPLGKDIIKAVRKIVKDIRSGKGIPTTNPTKPIPAPIQKALAPVPEPVPEPIEDSIEIEELEVEEPKPKPVPVKRSVSSIPHKPINLEVLRRIKARNEGRIK